MNSIIMLKSCQSRIDLALLLNCNPSSLAYLLYKTSPELKYKTFRLQKKTGGERVINAPSDKLKQIQRNLSDLLLNCIDNINSAGKKKSTLSHGFVRERSIITNAEMHKKTKNVLNIDLEDFFGSFNFGRVRGFFIKNKNFLLSQDVATTIAQIACFNNELPQGSPCSPVITNLITHSLDIRLASLAKNYSCKYTRYADDITFSTRESIFPEKIMKRDGDLFTPSPKLIYEISRSGFKINHKKTRIQFKDSRQDVTGLVVNKKVGVKKEYRQITKSMCNSLFHTGNFTKLINGMHVDGSLNELEGRLNFIDSIDFYHRINYPEKLSIHYAHRNYGQNTRAKLSGREKTLSKFLFYKNCICNDKPLIICEGKTDNIYLISALNKLASNYPALAKSSTITEPFKLLVSFLNYSKRTRFLLELAGGTSYLAGFIANYDRYYSFYKSPKSNNPVIIILDNDDGLKNINSVIDKIPTCTVYPLLDKKVDIKSEIKKANFVHVIHNLYLVITPLNIDKDTMIEDLFDSKVLDIKVKNRVFDATEKLKPKEKYYGKNVFATEVISKGGNRIDFSGFKPLFDRISEVLIKCKNI